MQGVGEAAVVFCLAYATAYGETLTIAHFPYYSFQVGGWWSCAGLGDGWAAERWSQHWLPSPCCWQPPDRAPSSCRFPSTQDRGRMYTVGSLFYAIYFFVSFPMFFRMDEAPRVGGALAVAALAVAALVAAAEHAGPARVEASSVQGVNGLAHLLPHFPLPPSYRPFLPQAKPFTLWRTVVDALAAGMLVTCLLDFWRLGVGGIVDGAGAGLPWLN